MFFQFGRCAPFVVWLLILGWISDGLALHPSAQTGDSSGRLLRSEDSTLELGEASSEDSALELGSAASEHRVGVGEKLMHIELDSAGKGRFGSTGAALAAQNDMDQSMDAIAKEAADPPLGCSSFDCIPVEEDQDMWLCQDGKCPIDFPPNTWGADGGVRLALSKSQDFGGIESVDGNNFLALYKKGSTVYQQVPGHIQDKWYTLWWYASCYSATASNASLKVSVDGADKFDEKVDCGPFQWYKAAYQAANLPSSGKKQIKFEIPATESEDEIYVLLDKVVIHEEIPWRYVARSVLSGEAIATAEGGEVLLQKVECTGHASRQTCYRKEYLTCGDYSEDGVTSVYFSTAARACSLFQALQDVESQKWKFKCNCLTQTSPDQSDGNWYLYSGYGDHTCKAKNFETKPFSSHTFDVREGLLNPKAPASRGACPGCPMLQLTTHGTACGALFAISEHNR